MSIGAVYQAGQFDYYIELRHRVLTPNDQGEDIRSWPTVYGNDWADKRDLTGDRRLLAAQYIAVQTTQMLLRFRGDILATDRLVTLDDGAAYEILQIAEVGRRQGLDLLCKRAVL